MSGNNTYHSIFGAAAGCVAVSPSDVSPVLLALDAKIKTSKRTINADDFFTAGIMKSTVLDDDEIVTEIQIPEPKAGTKQTFIKFTIRKSTAFPIVNVATAITLEGGKVSDARIVLGAVAGVPYRALKAEDALKGNAISESAAEAAGDAAVENTISLPENKYKIQIAKTLVKRAILA